MSEPRLALVARPESRAYALQRLAVRDRFERYCANPSTTPPNRITAHAKVTNRQIPSVTGRTSLLPRLLQWHIPGWLPRKEIMRTYEDEPVCYAGQ